MNRTRKHCHCVTQMSHFSGPVSQCDTPNCPQTWPGDPTELSRTPYQLRTQRPPSEMEELQNVEARKGTTPHKGPNYLLTDPESIWPSPIKIR